MLSQHPLLRSGRSPSPGTPWTRVSARRSREG